MEYLAEMPFSFETLIHHLARGIEAVGLLVLTVGGIVSFIQFFRYLSQKKDAYSKLRQNLGRSILLALEFLVAADIITTIIIEPTLTAVAVLSVVVLVRTFLSFSLELEISGRWPWQQSKIE